MGRLRGGGKRGRGGMGALTDDSDDILLIANIQPLQTDHAAVIAALSIRPCANKAAFLNWMSNLSGEALDKIKTDLESAVRTGNVKFLASILTDHLNEFIQAEASVLIRSISSNVWNSASSKCVEPAESLK